MVSFKRFQKTAPSNSKGSPQKLLHMGVKDILAFIIAAYQLFLPLVVALIIAITIGAVIFIFLF
jgi:hypothetical protein